MNKREKIAVVFGGSRGIGFSVSCKLIEEGYLVIVVCSTKDNVEKTKEAIDKKMGESKNYIVLYANVKQEKEIAELAKYISDNFGVVDYLVNCAGIMEPEAVDCENEQMNNWDETMNINLRGSFMTCKYMIPLLKKTEDAHIINVSGGLGLFSGRMIGGTLPAYRISKAAINALTLTLSEELKEKKIMVNSIDPGWVKTDLGGNDAPKMPEQAAEEIYQLLLKPFDQNSTGKLYKENKIIEY